MEKAMLKEEDKIFKNLYNNLGYSLEESLKRSDWSNTKEVISKGREWIINEIKISELRGRVAQVFLLVLNGHLLQKKLVHDLTI